MSAEKLPRVVRIHPRTNTIKLYKTCAEAARDLGLDPVTLSHACMRSCGMKRYGGYDWAYTDIAMSSIRPGPFTGHAHSDVTKTKMSEAKAPKKMAVEAYDTNGQFANRYESLCAASRAMAGNVNGHARINEAIKRNGRAYGHFWKKVA